MRTIINEFKIIRPNMKKKLWAVLAMCVMTMGVVTAKTKEPAGVYMYGLATSFMDSVVYVTDLQFVDKAVTDKKTGFLEARTVYSEQLRYYLEQQGLSPYMTCAVSFHPKKHQLLKKYQKILAKYKKKKGITLTVLGNGRFVFEPVVLQKGEEESNQETK